VNWPEAMGLIQATEYSGPLSVHATYSAFRDKEGALKMVTEDLAFLRPLVR
jgi:hypothetical protein